MTKSTKKNTPKLPKTAKLLAAKKARADAKTDLKAEALNEAFRAGRVERTIVAVNGGKLNGVAVAADAKTQPAQPAAKPTKAVASAKAPCAKCGRVNPSGKDCRTASACRRRVSKAKAVEKGVTV